MKILNGQEAFTALMAGKNIMCRAVGGLIEFDDLNQFPATVFAMPDYEFCIKIGEITINGYTFLKPYSLDELSEGQDVFLLGNTGSIISGQFIPEYDELVSAVKNGSVQRDFESAQKQAKAIQSLLGIDNDLVLKVVDFKDFIKPVTKSKKITRKKGEPEAIQAESVNPTGAESSNVPWEEIETDPIKLVENFKAQIEQFTKCDDVIAFRHVFLANGHLRREDQHSLCKLCEDKLLELDPQQYTPITQQPESDLSFDESAEYQSELNDLINRAQEAMTPAEATKLTGYTKSWTEIQRKPLIDAIHKRLLELNPETTPFSETPSLMVRIQNTINEHELNELLPEIRSRHPDIQPKLMGYVRARRFELENSATTVVTQ